MESDLDELLDTADRVISTLSRLLVAKGGRSLGGLYVALLEALTNAVVHENCENPEKTVRISTCCNACSEATIAVTD
jgi:anti-sigma regulatory factor (Ser/Thr protein kinase)